MADTTTRKLERRFSEEPYNQNLAKGLATAYLREGSFLFSEEDCELPNRGIFEGGYFACFAGVLLAYHVLERADTYAGNNAWDPVMPPEWRNYMLNQLMEDTPSDKRRERFFNSLTRHNYERIQPQRFLGRGWEEAEGVIEWERNTFNWISGLARNTRSGTEWQNNGRDVPGTSTVEILFSWPIHYEDLQGHFGIRPTREHGQLPSCKIRYNNPTPEMQALLCRINTKFFSHRDLPPLPLIQEITIAEPADDYDPYFIPLHIRGELLMPNCEQLRESYFQRYADVIARYPKDQDPDDWIGGHWLGDNPVCIRCPGCLQVYSIYKDGGDDPDCYCERCQFSLIETYADDRRHTLAYARQHASHLINLGYPWEHYPLYIPIDCSSEIKNKILDQYSDKLV